MRQIGCYYIEDQPLARGGMGQIFLGKDAQGHEVVVKEILPEFANDWSVVSRIEKEVEFLVKVAHPSIVTLYSAFRDEQAQCYYIVMEYVKGMNVEQYVQRYGAMPAEKAIMLMTRMLDAIQCIHNACIIHRDIKPSNIMIRPDDTICLLDFGVAKDVSANAQSNTIIGSVIGTTGYMSPEQANGFGMLDSGTGTMDKVEVKEGKLINCDMGDSYALVLIGGKMFKVAGTKLVKYEA